MIMKKQVSSIAKRIANIALFWRKSNFGKRIVERGGFAPSFSTKMHLKQTEDTGNLLLEFIDSQRPRASP
jgi:hypothetical protein